MMLNNGLPIDDDNPVPVKTVSTVATKKAFLYDVLIDDLQLAAGEEMAITVSVEGYESVFVMATGEATYDLYSYPSPNASDYMEKETLATGAAANVGVTKKPSMLAPYLKLAIKNTSAGAAKYTLWVYGV
jgi:hypothetical protein